MLIPLGILAASGAGVANQYELIESVILTSTQSSVTFSNLGNYSSTYKNLQVRVVGRDSRSANLSFFFMRFNSDSGTNYNYHRLIGTSSSLISSGSTNVTEIVAGYVASATAAASAHSATIIDILDAYDTSKFKTTRSLTGFGGGAEFGIYSGAWRNTNAISNITFLCETTAQPFQIGSRFSLYGVS